MDVYGLIGNPVGHSLSPPMHEAAYAEYGMDARYVAFEPAADRGAAAVEAAATLGVSGLNVTIPFKEDVLAAVEPDDLAARIGAVNTVDFSTSPPTGHNTDATGARRALEEQDALGGTAVVVGAGGAARAIAFALAEAGTTVRIANRTESRARSLAAAVSAATDASTATDTSTTTDASTATNAPASAHGLEALPNLLADADLLVNATSVGMDEDVSPVPGEALHADLVVFDAVYRPLETRLLREARAAGASTVDGARMLLYQGAEAFEHWTGRRAPLAAMDDALRARL